jgi:FdhD protein
VLLETDRRSPIRRFDIKRIEGASAERAHDSVAVEEPLAIHVTYWFKQVQHTEQLAVTMRTPGHDPELAAGLLVSEGVIQDASALAALRPLGSAPSDEILVELAEQVDFEGWRHARLGFVSSSCGICGKRTRESIAAAAPPQRADNLRVGADLLRRLPDLLGERQSGFQQTGGLHAAALITPQGAVEALFEDIGRHNALDKLVGWALLNGRIPLSDCLLFMSSRSSFELVQKAAMAGAPLLATVGGPSSLAIEFARERAITLIGFVRAGRFNLYSGDWRLSS